jgi:hypothetical protein
MSCAAFQKVAICEKQAIDGRSQWAQVLIQGLLTHKLIPRNSQTSRPRFANEISNCNVWSAAQRQEEAAKRAGEDSHLATYE